MLAPPTGQAGSAPLAATIIGYRSRLSMAGQAGLMSTVVLNGLFVGLVYGLLAVGLVVIYRTSRIINFAYGETGMLATFFYFDVRLGTNTSTFSKDHGIVLALLVALAIGAAIGIAMEVTIARP